MPTYTLIVELPDVVVTQLTAREPERSIEEILARHLGASLHALCTSGGITLVQDVLTGGKPVVHGGETRCS